MMIMIILMRVITVIMPGNMMWRRVKRGRRRGG